MQKKYINDFLITKKKYLSADYFILDLTSFSELPEIKPAQFVEVKVEGSPETFLRRPISIHDIDRETNTIKLLIRIVGKGTQKLSELKKGDYLNLIYPLGNSFSIPKNGDKKVLLVGGGCGTAPLLYTARYFSQAGFKVTSLLGFSDKENIIAKKSFNEFGELLLTTEDGSEGECGNVLQHSVFNKPEFQYQKIYSCGPEPMLKNLAAWSLSNNVECEVSLENMMACGFGACLCCVQKTKSGNKCVCVDGPVFNVNDIVW